MAASDLEDLKGKLEVIPKNPGVYLFKDKSDDVIYIGKAKILRNRVRSYFQQSTPVQPKTKVLVKKILDVEYIVTDNEKEALILEANLIKLYRPRYNVSLKDDKSFPYIKITNEAFPQVYATRKKINDGSMYFGPYTEVKVMRSLLWTLKKIFPIRSCQFRMTPKSIAAQKYKVCLDYHIKRCEGPCEGLVSAEDYNSMVDQIKDFLRGKTRPLIEILKSNMEEAANKRLFETAAIYRDRLREINNFQAKQKVVDMKPVERDIISVYMDDDIAAGVLFQEREGKILGRRHHAIDGVGDRPIGKVLQDFLLQIYINEAYVPPEILISNEIKEKKSIEEWLSEKKGYAVKIVTPQKGDKLKIIQMCLQNAELMVSDLMLQQRQKKDFVAYSVKALKKDLNMQELPIVIEAFDISNVQGSDAVSSMVSFKNGVPQKSAYRVFKIKTKDTPDDFAMIAEAVERRYSRLIAESSEMPDLILIDGGKGQLSSAVEALRKVGADDIPVIGLAKRLDEVFVPGIPDPQNISRNSSGLRLLQRVRDEAHRFAVMHHRKQRKKRTITSELDKIPGVGSGRRNELLKYFGSLAKVKAAEPETIAKVKSINIDLAISIHEFLNKSKDQKSQSA